MCKNEKYEIWKDENGLAHGRDCKTGRVFAIAVEVFDDVDMYAHDVRAGDAVCIKNANNICPTALAIISKAAKDLNDNAVMLRYAYGYIPGVPGKAKAMVHAVWSVLWTNDDYAVIERDNNSGDCPIVLCTTKSNLTIKGTESDSKHD